MNYKEQVAQIVSTAKFGDLIEFAYPIGYSHWGVYDGEGCISHFAVADESELMNTVRNHLQTAFPVCGDLLLGETKIRKQRLEDVNVPKGVQASICNNVHAYRPSSEEQMSQRREALLDMTFTYRLFTFNCEHYATYVRFGKSVCNQIPGQTKNKECETATEVFEDIVTSRDITKDLFK
ncbi:phospholipase A and acyltransferase 4-like [Aplochiton taeniatus]